MNFCSLPQKWHIQSGRNRFARLTKSGNERIFSFHSSPFYQKKKILIQLINTNQIISYLSGLHDAIITHLEPDILEYEVKQALGSSATHKASGGDGIPVELFQILKDDAAKVLHSICQHIWKTQQWPQDWKNSAFIPIPKKVNAKECSNYCTIALISHFSKVMLKILQARLQQYMNQELPDIPAGFRKGRGTRDQIANILWIIKKARKFQKKNLLY